MSTMNDEPEDEDDDRPANLHDEDEDDAHELECSGDELYCFTQRAMPHGRRAATWLLVGVLAELAVFSGGCFVANMAPINGLSSHLVVLLLSIVTIAIALMILVAVRKRWEQHRDCMERVIEEAMGWMAAAQRKALGASMDEYKRRSHARDEEARIDVLREELSWNVGPAPMFIAADDHEAIAAHEQRRTVGPEFGDLFDSLDGSDEQHDDDTESDNVPVAPAVRAWMQRWADVKPVKQSRPVPLLKRHDNAEGRRLERELCRAINRHWDGAFHRLLAEGANPNGHDDSGQPLRKAVLRGRLEHISWLLTLGADPNRQTFGRTMLATLMVQVDMQVDEGDGTGDDFEWPEIIELLARFGANPHIKNEHYDSDSDAEGPTAWPFICRYPVLYEAFMKGHNAWLQADADTMRVLREARESVGLAEVADETRALLRAARGKGLA